VGRKVLIIDDSWIARLKIGEIIKSDGFAVTETSSGQEALENIAYDPLDVILLDLLMPEMSGQNVLHKLSEQGCNIPVIVISADIQDTTKAECIGAGRGAEVLNSFLGSHVDLSVPTVNIVTADELSRYFTDNAEAPFSSVAMSYSGSVSGVAELVFLSETASKLVELITGENDIDHDFDDVKAATFSEVGNIIINAVLGAISNELELKLSFTIPHFLEGTFDDLLSLISDEETSIIIVAETQFLIKKIEIEGKIAIFFSLRSFDSFIDAVNMYV
jgi:chemotaxis protein CheC